MEGAPSTLSAAALSERHLDQATQERLVLPVREADVVLAQLCAALPVDVLPGASDPVNHALPQQPLHACLTPCARATPRRGASRSFCGGCAPTRPCTKRLGAHWQLASLSREAETVSYKSYRHDSQRTKLYLA